LEERQHMAAPQLAGDDHVACRVDAVDLKHRLCDVEPDRRDRLNVWLPESRSPPRRPLYWHLRAGGGAVHSIRSGHLTRAAWECLATTVGSCVDMKRDGAKARTARTISANSRAARTLREQVCDMPAQGRPLSIPLHWLQPEMGCA
jgi:hypothetical protein